LLRRLGVLIETREVRAVLVALIILSLLPFEAIEERLRWVFAVAFGLELAIRVPLLWVRRREGEAAPGALIFVVADVLALVSFLPLDQWLGAELDALKFLRLARLLVLLRFARALAADVYSILTRRELLQQFALVTVAVAAMAFVSAVILSVFRVPHDYDSQPSGDEGFGDQLWWSFRQLESADNLVATLDVHPVVLGLSLMLTITGVFVISFVIGIGTNVVEQVVRAERRRAVSYEGHTIVIGPMEQSEILVREFVRIYKKNRRDLRDQVRKLARWLIGDGPAPRAWRLPRMALLGPEDDPPDVLLEPGMRWVVYRQGDGGQTDALERIAAAKAKRVILIGDPSAGGDADAITVATLSAVREMNPHAHVFLELLSSRNFATLQAVAASPSTFPLDVPWLLGLFMLHHLTVPGVERLYRYLLTADGSELYSHLYRLESELEDVARQGDEDGRIDSHRLARLAAAHGVVLVGVFLGDRAPQTLPHDLIDTDGLVPWVNPHDEPIDPRLIALGAEAGRIPAAAIRGVIAVGDTYRPVRQFARSLADGPGPDGDATDGEVEIGIAKRPPRRILVVGYGDAIASLTSRLAELTEGAEVIVATDGRRRHVESLREALSRAGVSLAETKDGWRAELVRGGHLDVRTRRHANPMEVGLEALAEAPVEAVVFVAEEEAKDPDARTALRLMRLAEGLLAIDGPAPHVLAELTSVAKGKRARLHVEAAFARAGREPPRVTLVSTEQIRNYFMVHSAFVPGIGAVYGQLLGEVGQDLVELPVRADGPVTLARCAASLRERCLIPLGFERADGEVLLNPAPDEPVADVIGVYVIGEVDSEWTAQG